MTNLWTRHSMVTRCRSSALVSFVVCAAGTSLIAATPADGGRADVDARISKIKEQISAPPPASLSTSERSQRRNAMSRIFEAMNRVAEYMDDGNFEQAARSLTTVAQDIQDPALAKDVTALAQAVTALKASETASAADKARALLATVPDRMKAATKPEQIEGMDKEFEALLRTMSRSNDGNGSDPLPNQIRLAQQTVRRYAQVLAAESAGETDEALTIITELNDQSTYDGRVAPGRAVVRTKLAALQKISDDSFKKLAADQAKVVASAKSSQDLQPVIQQYQEIANGRRRRSREIQERSNQEFQMLRLWATVLDAEQDAKYLTALETLKNRSPRNIDDGSRPSILVPNTLLAQKTTALQQAVLKRGDAIADPNLKLLADTLSASKSLDEMEKALAAIEPMARPLYQSGNDADNRPVLEDLRQTSDRIRTLLDMRAAIKSREWGRFWQQNQNFFVSMGMRNFDGGRSNSRWDKSIESARMDLLRDAVNQNAELAGLKINVTSDAPIDVTMLNAADAALTAGNYENALQILQIYVSVAYGTSGNTAPPSALRGDVQGIETFIQARNFENAGDFSNALQRYRQVLQLNGPRVPIKVTTERMAALKKQQPELFNGKVNSTQNF